MTRQHRLTWEDPFPPPLQTVPVGLAPCELARWLEEHQDWTLSLGLDLAPEELRTLCRRHVDSRCPAVPVLQEIAEHQNSPADVLAELSAPRWREVHLCLALNPNISPDVLHRLSRSHRHAVLELVAANERTLRGDLMRLARHGDKWIRETGQRTLRRLDQDPDTANEDDHPPERAPIDLDPSQLSVWLVAHSDWVLSLDDRMAPDQLSDLYRRHVQSGCPVEAVLSEIAAHPNTPLDVLTKLAQPVWRAVHLSLAANRNLPPELLRRLARSRRLDVLEHVIWNRNTPGDEISRLAGHRHKHVVEQAKLALRRRQQRDAEAAGTNAGGGGRA